MKYLYQNKYWEMAKEYNIDKLLYLMIDRPKYIDCYNIFIWQNNKNQDHRNYDLPSCVYFYKNNICNLYWYKNSKNHRERSKPAIVNFDGDKQYWINNKFIKRERL